VSVQTYIDGVEVTNVVLSGSLTRRLNRISQATVRIPFGGSVGAAGSRLKVVVDSTLRFHGMIQTVSDDGDEDKLYSEYVAADPMEMWKWRPARDADGDFSKPTFFETQITGPQIMRYILENSEDAAGIPTTAEGPLFISYGSTFETGGVDLSAAPVDWPMTISEIADLLTSTGEVDIVLDPIDSGGNMAEVNIYNGDYGTDRSGSVSFDYGIGNFNVAKIRRVEDLSNVINKNFYYLGPRVETSEDPAGDQHWRGNITGDGSYWTNPSFQGVDMAATYPTAPDVLFRAGFSRGDYGTRMEIKIFDTEGAATLPFRHLHNRLWLIESWIRAQPRMMVHVTPVRGYYPTLDIGDLVSVSAGALVRGGFSGVQRIYEYTLAWDTDGVVSLGELVTSPSQEGI
jgi:hypothetical protein